MLIDNTFANIKKIFSDSSKPVSAGELMEFWRSLSEEEKQEWRDAAAEA